MTVYMCAHVRDELKVLVIQTSALSLLVHVCGLHEAQVQLRNVCA